MTDRLTDENLRLCIERDALRSLSNAFRARCAKLEEALRRTVKWRDWSIAERALAQPAESEIKP